MKSKKRLFGMLLCIMVMTGVMSMSVMAAEKINSVTIYGLDYPVKGKTLDTNYTLPSSGISYTVDTTVGKVVEWYDQGTQIGTTTSGTLIEDAEYTAVNGHYYMAKLYLCDVRYLDNSVLSYTYFDDNVSVVYESASRLKASSVTVTGQEKQAIVYLFFKADPLYDGAHCPAVFSDEVTEYEKIADETYAFKIPAGTYPWGAEGFYNYAADDFKIEVEWFKGTGVNKVSVAQSEPFVAGQFYTLRVILKSDFADKNAYFENEDGFLWLFINNTPGETYQTNAMSMISDFVCVAQGTVESVAIGNIQTPAAFEQMQLTGFSVTEGVKIKDAKWYQTSNVEFDMDVTGSFKPDTDYRLGLTLEPQDGYVFNFEQSDITVNAGHIGKYSENVGIVTVYIDFEIGSHTCSYPDVWEKDVNHHWKVCKCGEKACVAEHTYDGGSVTKQATATETGIKTYTCTVCGMTKTEVIPATGKSECPAKNTVITDTKTGVSYKVTKAGITDATVEFKAPKNKKVKKITISETVTIDGITFKVTSIAKNAFKGCTKLSTVTIGKNIKKIGASAFYNCTSLKTVTFKGTALTSVGSKAFKGSKKTITYKVPKKKAKAYEKLLKKKSGTYKIKKTK